MISFMCQFECIKYVNGMGWNSRLAFEKCIFRKVHHAGQTLHPESVRPFYQGEKFGACVLLFFT